MIDRSATFDRVATYRPNVVQSLTGVSNHWSMKMSGDLLYVRNNYNQVHVFDLAAPSRCG